MTVTNGRRRNVWMSDEMWAAVIQAAAHETVASGERVNASEFIRRAIQERLDKQD